MFTEADIVRIESELFRRSFRDFVIAGWSTFNAHPLILERPQEALIAVLQAVGDGRFGNTYDILLNVCPGHGKTSILTAFEAWVWARDPSESMIVASHTQDFANKKGQEFQDLVNSKFYQSHFNVKLKTDTVQSMKNSHNGVRDCTGTNGSVTGLHYGIQICDDLIDAKRADAPNLIAAANAWLDKTLGSRWRAGTMPRRIFINQRIAVGDVTDHVKSNPRSPIYQLVLPVIATDVKSRIADAKDEVVWEDDRKPGDILAPKLFPQAFIDGARKQMGSITFNAQFMQAPITLTSGITDPAWLQHTYDIAPTFDKIVMVVDTAITGKADPIALLTAGIVGSKAYLLDLVNANYTQLQTITQIEELEKRYHYDEIVIERAPTGVTLVDILSQTRANVVGISPGSKSKLERYRTACIALESGSVLFPNNSDFDHAKELILAFPNPAIHDEVVDTLAYLIHRYLLRQPEDIQAITAGMMQLLD